MAQTTSLVPHDNNVMDAGRQNRVLGDHMSSAPILASFLEPTYAYREFANFDRFADDEQVVSQVELAEAANGVSLDVLYDDEPKLAIRLRRALRTIANDIVSGSYVLPVDEQEWTREMQEKCRASFATLVQLLDRCDFHQEETCAE